MSDVKTWSRTAASNVADPPDGAPEGHTRPNVNDIQREVMAAVARNYEAPEWLDLNYDLAAPPVALVVSMDSAQVVRIAGRDLTAIYVADRRIRISGGSTIKGFVTSSTFSAPDTLVTVDLDGGATVPAATDTIESFFSTEIGKAAFEQAVDFIATEVFGR